MKLGPKEVLVALVSVALALGGGWAIMIDSARGALAALLGLALMCVALLIMALRRVAMRQALLHRIENKIDSLARRVVTESEASTRELSGHIDELARQARETR